MKKLQSGIVLTSIAVLALAFTGCGKKDAGVPTTNDTKKAGGGAAAAISQTAEAAKAEGTKAVESAKEAVSSKAQELIDKAKSLIAENKFQDASSALQQLTGFKLTGSQQKIVDGLKEEIQKALASKAAGEGASAVGNLLKK